MFQYVLVKILYFTNSKVFFCNFQTECLVLGFPRISSAIGAERSVPGSDWPAWGQPLPVQLCLPAQQNNSGKDVKIYT